MLKDIIEEQIDIAIANLIFSGLSIAQVDKIPKWLLEQIEKNKTEFKETTAQIVAREVIKIVESKKLIPVVGFMGNTHVELKQKEAYNKAIDDILQSLENELSVEVLSK